VQRGMRAVRQMKRDRVRCERANDVAGAWRDLRQVRPADPEWEDAQKLVGQLELCRTRVQVLVVRSAGGARRQQLELETRALQSQLRSDGHDARAECKGSTCSQIVVTIPGLDAKLADAITDGGSRVATALLGRLERAGAERVVFTGVERVTYSLQPTDLKEAGKELLARAQLDAPLELGGAAAEAEGPTADDLRPR